MKKLLVMMAIILSVAAVIVGKVHWDNKIEANAKVAVNSEKPELKSERAKGNNEEIQQEKVISKNDIINYTKNLPEEIVVKIETAVQTDKPLRLVIMGSNSTSEAPNGWPTLLKKELESTYGANIFQVTIKEFPNLTSTNIVTQDLHQEVIAFKPDVLLFEPFILADNGKVRMDDRLENIEIILTDFYNELPDLTVLLQPANPLKKATYYPNEVSKLKEFAEENGYIYLDHWGAWPDHQTDEITPYLENKLPSELGHKLWSEYLINYFISR